MKGVSVLIGAVLVIAISLAAIAIVLNIGGPSIDRGKEALLIREAENNMRILDNSIQAVAGEGENSTRIIDISVTDGKYILKGSTLSFSCDCKYLKPNLSNAYILDMNNIELGKSAKKIKIRNEGFNQTSGRQFITVKQA